MTICGRKWLKRKRSERVRKMAWKGWRHLHFMLEKGYEITGKLGIVTEAIKKQARILTWRRISMRKLQMVVYLYWAPSMKSRLFDRACAWWTRYKFGKCLIGACIVRGCGCNGTDNQRGCMLWRCTGWWHQCECLNRLDWNIEIRTLGLSIVTVNNFKKNASAINYTTSATEDVGWQCPQSWPQNFCCHYCVTICSTTYLSTTRDNSGYFPTFAQWNNKRFCKITYNVYRICVII